MVNGALMRRVLPGVVHAADPLGASRSASARHSQHVISKRAAMMSISVKVQADSVAGARADQPVAARIEADCDHPNQTEVELRQACQKDMT